MHPYRICQEVAKGKVELALVNATSQSDSTIRSHTIIFVKTAGVISVSTHFIEHLRKYGVDDYIQFWSPDHFQIGHVEFRKICGCEGEVVLMHILEHDPLSVSKEYSDAYKTHFREQLMGYKFT